MADLSLITFEADLNKFAKLLNLNIATLTKRLAFQLFNDVTLHTPVATGRARAGWGIALNTPQVATPPQGDYPAPGVPDLSAVNGKQVVYILNNVEYVEALEDGHSKQAPAGMVRLAIAKAEIYVENAIATLEK